MSFSERSNRVGVCDVFGGSADGVRMRTTNLAWRSSILGGENGEQDDLQVGAALDEVVGLACTCL